MIRTTGSCDLELSEKNMHHIPQAIHLRTFFLIPFHSNFEEHEVHIFIRSLAN